MRGSFETFRTRRSSSNGNECSFCVCFTTRSSVMIECADNVTRDRSPSWGWQSLTFCRNSTVILYKHIQGIKPYNNSFNLIDFPMNERFIFIFYHWIIILFLYWECIKSQLYWFNSITCFIDTMHAYWWKNISDWCISIYLLFLDCMCLTGADNF